MECNPPAEGLWVPGHRPPPLKPFPGDAVFAAAPQTLLGPLQPSCSVPGPRAPEQRSSGASFHISPWEARTSKAGAPSLHWIDFLSVGAGYIAICSLTPACHFQFNKPPGDAAASPLRARMPSSLSFPICPRRPGLQNSAPVSTRVLSQGPGARRAGLAHLTRGHRLCEHTPAARVPSPGLAPPRAT